MKANRQKQIGIWQPVGYSTHIITKKVSDVYGVKTSHTGTLDPMAEGVIVVLLDDERLKKEQLADTKKTYEFEMVFGIETDSYDGLGLIKHQQLNTKTTARAKITQILKMFKGDYIQNAPLFSTKKVKGIALHTLTRNNISVKPPKINGQVYKIKLISLEEKSVHEVKKEVIKKVRTVDGDFRQSKIISRWENFASLHGTAQVQIAKINVETSKGVYIRSLSQDICKKLGACGFVYSLVRTKNGKFKKANSKTLKQVFGTDFNRKLDFKSKTRVKQLRPVSQI